LGDVCPSGRLPFTNAVKLEDCPAEGFGERLVENSKYNDDIFVGYRGHEKDGIPPLFAFGHGLPYASFVYDGLKIEDQGEAPEISFEVANTSVVDGKEIAQIYFGLAENDGSRPVKERKGFDKKLVKAGERERFVIAVQKESLRVWDKGWKWIKGEYVVSVGSASDDIRLVGRGSILNQFQKANPRGSFYTNHKEEILL